MKVEKRNIDTANRTPEGEKKHTDGSGTLRVRKDHEQTKTPRLKTNGT
jgi:hypothetical protein